MVWFDRIGYAVIHGPDIAPDGPFPERAAWQEVNLARRLEDAVRRLNPDTSDPAIADALRRVGSVVMCRYTGAYMDTYVRTSRYKCTQCHARHAIMWLIPPVASTAGEGGKPPGEGHPTGAPLFCAHLHYEKCIQ